MFRLLLFVAFTVLSFQATRNSHQFAAVVGTVTAWNIGEWVGAMGRRARERGADPTPRALPRFLTLGAIGATFAWVASGAFYLTAAEGRVIGLGEQPLWYPHEAVKFAGGPGMPPRFLPFHIGHASLYDYYFGPERKVYVDARLEVIGADLFERYMELEARIGSDSPGWAAELDAIGRPVVLADHENNATVTATMLGHPDWRCVWFDPVAAVFTHAAHDDVARVHAVDFADRHFHPNPSTLPRGNESLLAEAKGLRNVASIAVRSGPAKVRGLVLLGLGHAARVARSDPSRPEPWKMLGQLALLRDPLPTAPRFRMSFDPVFDLTAVRSTYDLRRAYELAPDDFTTLLMLAKVYEDREMAEAAIPVLDRLLAQTAVNVYQVESQARAAATRASMFAGLGPQPPATWENLNDLQRIVTELLARGRARTAADYLEKATEAPSRSWEDTDRIATLRLHLGEPASARLLWQAASAPPAPAIRAARVAVTHFVEGDLEKARESYAEAIRLDSRLFEAHYGLAVLEQDGGRAPEALDAARRAVGLAPSDLARDAAQQVVAMVTPYANSPIAAATRDR